MYFSTSSLAVLASLAGSALCQQIAQDSGRGGVSIEFVHLYNDQFPQGKLPHTAPFESADTRRRHRRLLHWPQIL